jgi:hypothetical protein
LDSVVIVAIAFWLLLARVDLPNIDSWVILLAVRISEFSRLTML